MQLEKATADSSEAGLAGWISSNDATLFTMVLVVVVAVFLHSRLERGEATQLALASETETLAADLRLTQQQRDQLQQQLADEVARLAKINARLDAALAEKGELEARQRLLSDQVAALSAEKQSLAAQGAELAKSRDSLSSDNASLHEQLEATAEQLAAKLAALGEVEQQRDRLKQQAEELEAILAGLNRKVDELNLELSAAEERAARDREAWAARADKLESRVAAGDQTAEEHLAKLRLAEELFQQLTARNETLQRELSAAERRRQMELLQQTRYNRELVGLKGSLRRVAILFDASGSMRHPASGSSGDRWAEAQEIAATWLKHLDLQECVLIVFSSHVRTFPPDGTVANLSGAGAPKNRQAMLDYLTAVKPGGTTNTYDALRKAYEYQVDSILLFTDGAPSRSESGVFDPAIANQIYELCRQRSDVPVNTVGLGNYFDKDMSTFLWTLAKLTGGTFHGR